MAYVPVNVDSNGDADNPGVSTGDSVQWILQSGVAGPFALNPPPNMFRRNDNPKCVELSSASPCSLTYTVKNSATMGDHDYFIDAGHCIKKSRRTGPQKITVNA